MVVFNVVEISIFMIRLNIEYLDWYESIMFNLVDVIRNIIRNFFLIGKREHCIISNNSFINLI